MTLEERMEALEKKMADLERQLQEQPEKSRCIAGEVLVDAIRKSFNFKI
ncbi:hypothetical protein [Desulfosporosinus sp. SB140]